jgi:Transposase IS66 family
MKTRLLPYVEDQDLPPRVGAQLRILQCFSEGLIEENHALQEKVARLKDELAVLKGEKKRPVFKPSRMHEEAGKVKAPAGAADGKQLRRAGSDKRSKTRTLKIDKDCVIEPAQPVPPGSRFLGYRDFVVQDLVIKASNTRYRLARWQTPQGKILTGRLPKALKGRHFGPTLGAYVLYQHHQCQVTQALLREQLREWDIDISTGQINALLCHDKERYHAEKDDLLSTGLAHSTYVTVDDTGSRHQGNNAYVTHIGNEYFAWFKSTLSKSRINFLELLRAGDSSYWINATALDYMKQQGLSQVLLEALRENESAGFANQQAWHEQLQRLGIDTPRERRIATEGALLGCLKRQGVINDLAIISDDAGQFNVLLHGLCWVHTERLVHKLLPFTDAHREDIARVRGEIWELYADLKLYKEHPAREQKAALAMRFDAIFTQKTRFTTLNQLLKRIHRNKSELLLVLDRPDVPLHTNGSEGDIRDHVKKQKVSGGTRSDLGRQCRDTFSSLKKTCRKLGISFWQYLTDRISYSDYIPPLSELIKQRMTSSGNVGPPIAPAF